jgi:hypothetical protein
MLLLMLMGALFGLVLDSIIGIIYWVVTGTWPAPLGPSTLLYRVSIIIPIICALVGLFIPEGR